MKRRNLTMCSDWLRTWYLCVSQPPSSLKTKYSCSWLSKATLRTSWELFVFISHLQYSCTSMHQTKISSWQFYSCLTANCMRVRALRKNRTICVISSKRLSAKYKLHLWLAICPSNIKWWHSCANVKSPSLSTCLLEIASLLEFSLMIHLQILNIE